MPKQLRSQPIMPFWVFAIFILAALACNAPGVGGNVDELTPTPATTPTPVVAAETDDEEEEETPEETEEEPEEEATSEPTPVPEDTGDGSSTEGGGFNMAFVQDVNVPDGTRFDAGTQFDKTWRVRNNGSVAWSQGTQLVYLRGNQLGGPGAVTVPPTAVNNVIDVTVSLTAPSNNGEYQSYWRLREPGGQFFGPEVFVIIEVANSDSDDNGDDNDNGDNEQSADGPDLVIRSFRTLDEPEANQEFELEIIVKNEGNQTAAESVLQLDIEGADDPTFETPELGAGEEATITPEITLEDEQTYKMTAAADIDGDVTETNEGNNAAIIEVEVGEGIDVLESGSLDIEANDCVDFDVGNEGACGGDSDVLWFVDTGDPDERELRVEDDARIAVYGTGQPSYDDCKSSGLDNNPIGADTDDNDIPDGTYVCFETDQDNIGYFLVDDYDDTLEVNYLTWDEAAT